MAEVISKSLQEITLSDVQALVALQVSEDQHLEFKESLPSDGNTEDPWIHGRNRIGDRAKTRILEEVVAFANAQGGALLIGVEESDATPPAAAAIKPVPRCRELAKRFELVFRDGVDPQLPGFEALGIPTEGESGVVLLRADESMLAPHRVIKTRKCTIRRSDRCEHMGMREIQDLTLHNSRRSQRLDSIFSQWLDSIFSQRSDRFDDEYDLLANTQQPFGFRMTALPAMPDQIDFDAVFRNRTVIPECAVPIVTVRRKGMLNPSELEVPPDFPLRFWRPMLRGARSDRTHYDVPRRYMTYAELHCDGLLELGFCAGSHDFRGSSVPPDWPISMFAHLLAWADRVRDAASAATIEYILEVEIRMTDEAVAVGYHDPISLAMRDLHSVPKLASIKFPRYALQDRRALEKILNRFECDFWNSMKAVNEYENEPLEISF